VPWGRGHKGAGSRRAQAVAWSGNSVRSSASSAAISATVRGRRSSPIVVVVVVVGRWPQGPTLTQRDTTGGVVRGPEAWLALKTQHFGFIDGLVTFLDWERPIRSG